MVFGASILSRFGWGLLVVLGVLLSGSSSGVTTEGSDLATRHVKNGGSPCAPAASPPAASDTSLFEDVTGRLGHSHVETPYQDFKRQPLLSRRLSRPGPAAAWADLDADDDPDLLIGTGRGGTLAYYQNDGNGHFQRIQGGALDETRDWDLTGIVTIPSENGATVFVGRANYERTPTEESVPSRILISDADAEGLRLRNRLRFGRGTVGPLALADIDMDGDLDLFAAGRHRPGKYPASASSVIFRNTPHGFQRDANASRPFSEVGLITGAVFADIGGGPAPDLLLSSEWGPIHYYQNRGNGRFVERTDKVGLAEYTGFWQGVDVGDFNGDGHLDIAAANWGWNSRYGQPPGAPKDVESPRLNHPLRVYYSDYDRNGIIDVLETHYLPGRDEYVPYKDFSQMGDAMNYLRGKVKTYERFAEMSIEEIIGESRFEASFEKSANTLSHMVFLNQGPDADTTFQGHALPGWSQLSAAFAPSVADLDGDGNQDLLLSQNFFATHVKTRRQDGGRALWLRGDGSGEFTPVKGHESGLIVYGEQRAAPLADIDGDGRLDALVTQNGAETTLFKNVGATPGLRVRLQGPSGNRRAVGAVVRPEYEEGSQGPATPVTAGSSYWSQEGRTVVLGRGPHTISSIHVRWPSGTETEHAVEADAGTVTIAHPNK